MNIGVLDVGLGNVGSVFNIVRYLGHEPVPVAASADAVGLGPLMLPGVGSFDAGMTRLRDAGLDEVVVAAAGAGRPVLGICLGMQLLMSGSAEGVERGLGIITETCNRLQPVGPDGRPLVVPHMGWNDVEFSDGFLRLPRHEPWRFYFVHSYAAPAAGPFTRGVTDHGGRFASVVQHGSVVGAQFHPEKSHRFGMRFLEAWIAEC